MAPRLSGCRCRRYAGEWLQSPLVTLQLGLKRRRITRWYDGSCGATAEREAQRCRRRTRCSLSIFRRSSLPCRDDLPAQRDRALLLLGYAGAFRRSELVALDFEHLRFTTKGCYVWIATAKNDSRKEGRELYVPRLPISFANSCAIIALERWLDTVSTSGPIFKTFNLHRRQTPTRLD